MARRNRFDTPADLLEYEFGQEKASALGRMGRALEAALAALAEFDGRNAAGAISADGQAARAALVSQASLALWHFIVQREACGLRDMRQVMRDYRIPSDVAARMGAWPAGTPGKRRSPRA